jgi:hypothetical protein
MADDGASKEIAKERPAGYPKSNIDNLIGLIRGRYDKNYCSSINRVRTSWLTDLIAQSHGLGWY